MQRRLSNFLNVTLAMICIGWCALWIRGHWVLDKVQYRPVAREGRFHLLTVHAGWEAIVVLWSELEVRPGMAADYETWLSTSDDMLDPCPPGWRFEAIDPPMELTWPIARARLWKTRFETTDSPLGRSQPYLTRNRLTFVAFPIWPLALVFAIPPLISIFRFWRRRKRRFRPGHCGVCGYDVQATPDRCPECGEKPENLSTDLVSDKPESK